MTEDDKTPTKNFEHSGRVIRDEIRIEATPEEVYRAWAEPEEIQAWFVGRMDGKMEPGETVTWFWDSTGTGMSQKVMVADAPHRLVTEMELPQGVSYLEVTIEQEGGHSILRLVQSGFGTGKDWDDQYEGMLSGWMVALAVLKFFAERYAGRRRREFLVLGDAPFDEETIQEAHRSEEGLKKWLSKSGSSGKTVGEPVHLILENGMTLTGQVLRATKTETLLSWDEIEGVIEMKAFKGAYWGSKVGIRVSSWMEDIAALADLEGWMATVVEKLTVHLTSAK